MKKIFMMLLAAMIVMPVFAGEKLRVAVFDPTSSGTAIDEGTKVAIREIISSTIVNAGDYDIVERSLLEKVMQEQSFSNSGAVDDNDATEIGKLAGANKVVLSVVTLTGGRNMLSVKMIDVKTASVERQKVKVVASGELLDAVEPITLALIDASYSDDDMTVIAAPAEVQEVQDGKPMPRNGEVVFYLPSGYEPPKEKDKDLPLLVKLDKEDVGSGTLSTGFTIRMPNPGSGVRKLKVGAQKAINIDLSKYNFFEFQVYRGSYLGIPIYGVSLKEQKMIGTGSLADGMRNKQPQQPAKTEPVKPDPQEAQPRKKQTHEFVLSLPPQQIANEAHSNNYIKVELDGKVIGGGTLAEGFEIRVQEKKHRKYVLEIYPTSTSKKGKTDEKAGKTKFEIDTRQQQYIEFMLQTRQKDNWTIYSVVRR